MKPLFIWILGGVLGLAAVALLVWFVFFRATPGAEPTTPATLGTGSIQNVGVSPIPADESAVQAIPVGESATQKVFKIADGPVTGAAFIQTLYPTTTLVRYALQENGHVFDFTLDSPGAIARAVSNTTIPATHRAVWGEKGNGLYLQYQDSGVIKTVSLLFPSTATTSGTAIQIQFLPDNVSDLAASPDGKQVAYLVKGTGGTDGYIAKSGGSNAKKLFSLGLSELLLSWPAQNTLLLATKSAANIPGVVFSVNAGSGAVTPLIYALGVTATADKNFANVVYQTAPSDAARPSYAHNIKKGTDVALSFDPIPEKCAWSSLATSTIYCAAPLQYTAASYLDLWHMGASSLGDAIISFDIAKNYDTSAVATPGSADGGVSSDIAELLVSPDDKYLLFIKKGDRSLWAVRL